MARQYVEIEKRNWGNTVLGIFAIFLAFATTGMICAVPNLPTPFSLILGGLLSIVLVCGVMILYEDSKETVRKYVKTEGR